MRQYTNMEERFIAFVRLFKFDIATNIAHSAEIIAFEARMTALFSLHWVVACKEKAVWTENNILTIFAVPGRDT